MKNYRVLLIDDEPLLCQYLQKSLEDLWPELEIVGTASNGEQALIAISEMKPDLIFLDVRMPKLDGMSVAKQLTQLEDPPLIVFVTAYDQYAVEAFEEEAVDYLLKPVEEVRLRKTLDRVRLRLDGRSLQENSPGADTPSEILANLLVRLEKKDKPPKLVWIKAMRQESIYLISPDDVYYFQAEDKYTTVVTMDGEYIIRTPIKELKDQLDENLFLQIRRGTLVNSKYIEKIHRDFSGHMYVSLKGVVTQLQISRNFCANFKQM